VVENGGLEDWIGEVLLVGRRERKHTRALNPKKAVTLPGGHGPCEGVRGQYVAGVPPSQNA